MTIVIRSKNLKRFVICESWIFIFGKLVRNFISTSFLCQKNNFASKTKNVFSNCLTLNFYLQKALRTMFVGLYYNVAIEAGDHA